MHNGQGHRCLVKGPVSNLWRHLEVWHRRIFNSVTDCEKKGNNAAGLRAALELDWKLPNSSSFFTPRLLKQAANPKLSKEAALTLFFIKRGLPLSAFDDPSWKEVSAILDLQLHGSSTIQQMVVPALYQLVVDKVKKLLSAATSGAVQADSWDSLYRKGKTIGVKVSFISLDWELRHHLLGLIEVDTELTAPVLDALIQGRVNSFTGPDFLVSGVVTDNGSNFAAAAALSKEPWPCMCHTIQLAVRDVIDVEGSEEAKWMSRVHEIAFLFQKNRNLARLLRDAQGTDPLSPVLPGETRWNSQFDMLDRFLQLFPFINPILLDPPGKDLPHAFTGDELKRLELLRDLLQPLATASRQLEGDGLTLGSTLRVVDRLLRELHPSTDLGLTATRAKLFTAVDTRLGWIRTSPNHATCAAALTPNSGFSTLLAPALQDQVFNTLAAEAMESSPAPTLAGDSPVLREEIEGALKRARSMLAHEANQQKSPLEFWKQARTLHVLYPLVRSILCVPAASAGIERAFSGAKYLQEGKFALQIHRLEELAIIRDFMLQPDYCFADIASAVQSLSETK